MKTYVLLGISLEMTSLSRVINFLEVTTVKTSFAWGLAIFSCIDAKYSDSLASIAPLVNTSNIFTCFRNIRGFPQLCSIDARGAKSADVGNSCIGGFSVRDACIESADTESPCARGFCIKDVYIKAFYGDVTCIVSASVGYTYSWGACIDDSFAREVCARSIIFGSAYIDSTDAIECSKIHWQFFQIS